MTENKCDFNEKEYEKCKQKVQLCLMGLCLLILSQIFLFCYGKEKQFMLNIAELEFLCEQYPSYFCLLYGDEALRITMSKEEEDFETFLSNSNKDLIGNKNYTHYYIGIDDKGNLVFRDNHIEEGVKSFYENAYRYAMWSGKVFLNN